MGHVAELPKYLNHATIAEACSFVRNEGTGLTVDIRLCTWAEHFEAQKLLVALKSVSMDAESLILLLPGQKDCSERNKKAIRFFDTIGFFETIASGFKEVTLEFSQDTVEVVPPNEISSAIHETLGVRTKYGAPYSGLPITCVNNQEEVENVSSLLTEGAVVESLLHNYTGMDYLASGEFGTLVMNELAQNIVEHACGDTQDSVSRYGYTSIDLVRFRAGSDRYNNRIKYSPKYEVQFIKGSGSSGYLELVVTDGGRGVIDSLSSGFTSNTILQEHVRKPDDPRHILAAAFHHEVTRDPGDHRPGHRGLFHVLEFVREHEGCIFCQANGYEISITPNDYPKGPIFTGQGNLPALASKSHSIEGGTNIRILLPLSSKGRSFPWKSIRPIHGFDFENSMPPIEAPNVVALPDAPATQEMSTSPRNAMEKFRKKCRESLPTQRDLDSYSVFCLSGCRTQRWRKPHMQMLLDEISGLQFSSNCIALINVPTFHFRTLLHLAKRCVALEAGNVLVIVDQEGNRAFSSWESSGGLLLDSWCSAPNKLPSASRMPEAVFSFISRFSREFGRYSFDDLLLTLTLDGVSREFEGDLETFRFKDHGVQVDQNTVVRGFVELDEALKETAYLRSLSMALRVIIRCWNLVPGSKRGKTGWVVLRRAARMIVEYSSPHNNLWIMETSDLEALPSSEWINKHDRIYVINDILFRGVSLARILSEICARATLSPSIAVVVPVYVPPAFDEKDQSGSVSVVGNLDSHRGLISTTSGSVPAIWIQSTKPVEIEGEPATGHSAIPDRWTNILFDPEYIAHREKLNSFDPKALELIRLAAKRDAILLGHLSITSEHFDLEFDLAKLLSNGSPLLTEVAGELCSILIRQKIDLIVYPDDSQIQKVFSQLEKSFDCSGLSFVRLRRSGDGRLFCRKRDIEDVSKGSRVLLIDDAINSGGTIREMTSVVTACSGALKKLFVYAIVSRQDALEERLFGSITEVKGIPIEYRRHVHFPVSFWKSTTCPLCKRRDIANAFGSATGDRSKWGGILRELAADSGPLLVYRESNARTLMVSRPDNTTRSLQAPVLSGSSLSSETFNYLDAAKAAVALAVGQKMNIDVSFALGLLSHCGSDTRLSAYAFYAIASRLVRPDAFWMSRDVKKNFVSLCQAIMGRNASGPLDDVIRREALVALCLASWFAPRLQLGWIVATILRECSGAIRDDLFYREIVLLAARLAEKLREESDIDTRSRIDEAIADSVQSARNREISIGEEMPTARMQAAQRMMRVRAVSDILSDRPGTLPWFDHVQDILWLLSYRRGHHFINHLRPDDVFEATLICESLRSVSGSALRQVGPVPLPSLPVVWKTIDRFLANSTRDLGFLSTSLKPTVGTWLRALDYMPTHELTSDIDKVLQLLDDTETVITELLELFRPLRNAFNSRDLDAAAKVMEQVVLKQQAASSLLYEHEHASGGVTIRSVLEQYLCPLFDLVKRFSRDWVSEELTRGRDISLTVSGSFFEYAERVLNKNLNPTETPWSVIVGRHSLLEQVLKHVIVENVAKHVVVNLASANCIELTVELDGISSTEAGPMLVSVSTAINGQKTEIPDTRLGPGTTLDRQRGLLQLYGGDIAILDSEIVVSLISGHF